MENIQENWRPVVDLEGLYEVSDLGRVRSLRNGRILKPQPVWSRAARKYWFASMYANGKNCPRTIHRLVMEAFVGKRPKGMQTNHISGDKRDNRLANLEYVSHQENYEHAVQHNLCSGLNEQQVRLIRQLRDSGVKARDIQQRLLPDIQIAVETIYLIGGRRRYLLVKEA